MGPLVIDLVTSAEAPKDHRAKMKKKSHPCGIWYVSLHSSYKFCLSDMHSGKVYANPTNVKRHMKKEHPSWCRSHTTYLSNFINNANCWILVCILLCSSHYRLKTYFISPTNVTSPSLSHPSASDLARPHRLSLGLRSSYLRN